jgi:cell division protein FtsL
MMICCHSFACPNAAKGSVEMIRYINILSIAALVGSASYAYSIKYETMRYSAEIVKLKHAIEREHTNISMLRAEWAHVTRPSRVQALADLHLTMQPVSVDTMVKPGDLPERAARVDSIGRKLEALGLSDILDKRPGAR